MEGWRPYRRECVGGGFGFWLSEVCIWRHDVARTVASTGLRLRTGTRTTEDMKSTAVSPRSLCTLLLNVLTIYLGHSSHFVSISFQFLILIPSPLIHLRSISSPPNLIHTPHHTLSVVSGIYAEIQIKNLNPCTSYGIEDRGLASPDNMKVHMLCMDDYSYVVRCMHMSGRLVDAG
jgi:hypothetical protein